MQLRNLQKGTKLFQIVICYKQNKYTYYKASKYRTTEKIVSYFTQKQDFSHGMIFGLDRGGKRGRRLFYFNTKTSNY